MPEKMKLERLQAEKDRLQEKLPPEPSKSEQIAEILKQPGKVKQIIKVLTENGKSSADKKSSAGQVFRF